MKFDTKMQEKTKPSFNTNQFQNDIKTFKYIGIPVLLLILLIYGFRNCSRPELGGDVKISNKLKAFTMSQIYIKKILKAPSTAKFPVYDISDVVKTDSRTYEVTSWVDSENSFGAMLRSNYLVRLKYFDDQWSLRYLEVNGKQIYP